MAPWRLLDCGPAAGDWNMALDRALLEVLAAARASKAAVRATASDASRSPVPVLRFYAWEAPTLSFGRLQHPSPELLRRCRELGVPAVRRPTGGRAILHQSEVTFSIIAPTTGLGSVMQSYRRFARAIAAGLLRLGITASLCDGRAAAPDQGLLCFADPAGCDLQAGGRKLVGSAQARRAGGLLQQNSLPLRLAHEFKPRLLGAQAEQEARRASDLESLLGRLPSYAEVRAAIIAGFEAELGIDFEAGVPTGDEHAAAQQLRASLVL